MPELVDHGGTIRARHPASTLGWIREFLPDFGITRVADVTGLDRLGIPVMVCIRPNARNLATSQGKGTTRELAWLSAVMEAIEDFHSESPTEPDVFASLAEVGGLRHLNPVVLSPGAFQSSTERLGWVWGTELFSGEAMLVPRSAVCLDTSPTGHGRPAISATSTGLASGNTTSEAVFHSLCEILERHHLANWQDADLDARARTTVNLDTLDDHNTGLVEKVHMGGSDVAVWNIGASDGLPAFRCELWDPDPLTSVGLYAGMGAHPLRRIALSRAITEAAQTRLTFISGSRDDLTPERYRRQQVRSYGAAPWTGVGVQRFDDIDDARMGECFADGVDVLLGMLSRMRIEQIAMVTHTREPWNIPVVHSLAPGMRDTMR